MLGGMKKEKNEIRQLAVKTDYHTHSNFSPDGHHTPEAMCAAALNLGLESLALTEHAEWFGFQPGFPHVDRYWERIMACQAQFGPEGLTVLPGVELGNPHDYAVQAGRLLNRYPFAVVIGSIHYLNGHNIHLPQCFANKESDDVFHDYFVELRRMVENFPVDFVAHFDRIFWRAYLLHLPFDPYYHEEVIREALTAIARRSGGLELNTKLLGQEPNWHQVLQLLLGWYAECGGHTVLVNSDAHGTTELGQNQTLALQLLAGTGLKVGKLPQKVFA